MSDAIVLFDYRAQTDAELTLKKGDLIKNIDKNEEIWWEGELCGRRGMFHIDFIKEVERYLPESREENSVDKPAGDAIVLFDYRAQSDAELTLKKGDLIKNIDKKEEIWWEGELCGRRGMFHIDFIKEVERYLPESSEENSVDKPDVVKRKKKKKRIKGLSGVGFGKLTQVARSGIRFIKRKPAKPHLYEEIDLDDCTIIAKVIFDHDAESDNELSLRKGEFVKVLNQEDKGWWTGLQNGKIGLFPSNYVELEEDPYYILESPPTPVLIAPENEEPVIAKVIFDYDADSDDELSLRKGEFVEVLNQEDKGWWTGLQNGKIGSFPSNYVELEEDSYYIPESPPTPVLIAPENEEPVIVKVICDRHAESDDELSLRVGEIVEVTYQGDEVWWTGLLNGKVGLFPSNYVELDKGSLPIPKSQPTPVPIATANEAPDTPEKRIKELDHVGFFSSLVINALSNVKSRNRNSGTQINLIQKPEKPAEQLELRQKLGSKKRNPPLPPDQDRHAIIANVIFDYDAESDDELTLRKGEIVDVFGPEKEEGWLKGSLNGKVGLFPSNFVELGKDSVSIPESQPTLAPTTTADKNPVIAKVIFDYDAESDDELTLRKGEIVDVFGPEKEEGWLKGSLNGKVGLFPSNFVELGKGSVYIPESQPTTPAPTATADKNPVIAKVIFDYDAESDDELTLKKGEIVDVFGLEEEGWLKGSLDGKVGLFPSNFVELGKGSVYIPESQPTPATTATAGGDPEPRSQLMWMKTSEIHREKFQKLLEYGQKFPEEMKKINGVTVCFKAEFRIGTGSDGTCVFIGLAKDGCEKAVKRILKHISGMLGLNAKKILNTPNTINSKHVVNYWYYDEQSHDDFAFLILDLHEGTLQDYVKTQSQEILTARAPDITRQIIEGLNDLHCSTKPILHRDLKPSNILRNVLGDWILADFGISRTLLEGQTTYQSNEKGTTFWRAVESYPLENRNDESNNESSKSDNDNTESDNKSTKSSRYKKQSDIQVAGMVSFYILTKGKHPFGPETDCVRNLCGGNPVGLVNFADPVAKDFISWMIQHNPEDRPYAHEALKHPYLLHSDQQFELLKCVGNEAEIKKGETTCDVVNEINTNPLLPTRGWKSQIHADVLRYIIGKREYRDEWTQCLRFIRNTSVHWNDNAPPETVQNEVGEPQKYFLKLFPTLPVVVHRVIRSKKHWKKRKDLKKFF